MLINPVTYKLLTLESSNIWTRKLLVIPFTFRIRNGKRQESSECRLTGIAVSEHFGYPTVPSSFPIIREKQYLPFHTFLNFASQTPIPSLNSLLKPSSHHFCSSMVGKAVSRMPQELQSWSACRLASSRGPGRLDSGYNSYATVTGLSFPVIITQVDSHRTC